MRTVKKTVRHAVAAVGAKERKQRELFDLARLFRAANEPLKVRRLGDQLGRLIFGTNPNPRDV